MFAVEAGYPENRMKFAQEIGTMAFFLSLLALGLAGATGVVALRALAAAQTKQRVALRPVRVSSSDRLTERRARRG
ncbi:hypothetical protein FSB65_37505 [Paraburkholderia sp. JPY418]|uniref:Uncharacterized protein n=1 Tax=Paraburkholderia youngii TaxID=2782701 RepID=A0ABX2NVU9_9BURK|nr:hypothetical protein [Paraburkholderia youngii]NVI08629.1 hypothetical protein [Paraburkholderia youngii]